VWFCFVGDPSESKDKYNENFQQIFLLKSPVDLAYAWKHYELSNLENFLVNVEGKQKRYPPPYPATRSRRSGEGSTPSSTSRKG